jgi:hypothetical protein
MSVTDTRYRIIKRGVVVPKLIDPIAGTEINVADLTAAAGFTEAAFVADADDTSATTVAAAVDALRDSLIAAGLMAAS